MDFWTACRVGDLESVRQVIQDGQDVNIGSSYGTTPLMDAAYWGHDQVVHELIRAGAYVNKKENDKQTALHRASCNGHSSVVKTLAEAGAYLNVQNEYGRTPFMEAAYWGRANVVVELIGVGADVNRKDNDKQTALHRASCKGHSSVVKALTEAGANLNVQDKWGVTPLMEAAYWGRANVVVELIRAGADVSVVSSHRWGSVTAGSTALHFAATENSIECGALLVEAGADMRTRNKDSKSPMDLASYGFRQAALHKASSCGHSNVVATLAEAGANLNEQDERGVTPLMKAAYRGCANVVVELIRAGADVSVVSSHEWRSVAASSTALDFAAEKNSIECGVLLVEAGADMRTRNKDSKSLMDLASHDFRQAALHKASSCGNSSVVTTLAEAGANLNEQDEWGVTPLMKVAYRCCANVVVELIRAGADVGVVSSCEWRSVAAGSTALHFAAKQNSIECGVFLVEAGADMRTRNKDSKSPMDLASHDFQQAALHKASSCGHSNVVATLAEAGANLNEQDERGMTPLMEAAYRGCANVVVELIRAGADVSVVSSRKRLSVSAGSTALHFAAKEKSMECGVLLVEAGAHMRTRNKDSKSPLDLASHDFRQAIQQAQSFSTKRIVAVIGNAENGKSTLIAALQAEGNSLLKTFTNKFTKVQDIRQRTAGIEAVQFSSQKYGATLFYDFAGQSDYLGPHQSFLEAMFSKLGVSVTLLLVVKSTDEEEVITQQVTHWLQPLSLTSAPSTPQVILVGSFLDQVESRKEATEKLLRCTHPLQEQFHFNIQGPCLLDCRRPASEGIDQICTFLRENEPLQLNCKSFPYSLRWILVQVRKGFSVPAISLHTFQSWLLNDAKLSPQHFPPAEQICLDLTSVGHTLFLPNKQDPSQSWLILDLQAILHDVYGTLFSGSQGKVNQFGLLHCSQLIELLPELDPAMIQELLVSLEFCIQVDSSLLQEELLNLTAKDEGEGWLYFPVLVSAQPPEIFPEVPDSHHLQWVCWQLRTADKCFISAHLLQTVILRLAANHVFTHELPSVREHCCSVWVNGLSWMSTNGVDIAVQISDSSVVQVVGRSKAGPEKLHQYTSTIVSNVIRTTTQLSPKLEATSYIVHPYTPAMWEDAKDPSPDFLYPVSSIIRCISDRGSRALSRTRQDGRLPHQTSLTELFGGWSPPLSVVQDMDFKTEPQRAQGEPTSPQDGQSHPDGKAQQVLDEFRDQFIQDMDSNAIVPDLLHHDIITEGDQRTITMTMDRTQQNKFLHLYLRKCTEDAFHRVCDIISGVKGDPKMSALGTAMKQRLVTAPLSLAPPSVLSSPSSQSGAPTADKGPSTEEEALPATQQAQGEPTAPQDGQSHPDGNDTPTHFSIDSTPSFQAIRKLIVRQVASDWSTVAVYLGLESSVIRMAKTDHPQQCEHACADIFERWLSWEEGTGERERTWRTVLSVVEEAGHKAFVNRLKAERFNLH